MDSNKIQTFQPLFNYDDRDNKKNYIMVNNKYLFKICHLDWSDLQNDEGELTKLKTTFENIDYFGINCFFEKDNRKTIFIINADNKLSTYKSNNNVEHIYGIIKNKCLLYTSNYNNYCLSQKLNIPLFYINDNNEIISSVPIIKIETLDPYILIYIKHYIFIINGTTGNILHMISDNITSFTARKNFLYYCLDNKIYKTNTNTPPLLVLNNIKFMHYDLIYHNEKNKIIIEIMTNNSKKRKNISSEDINGSDGSDDSDNSNDNNDADDYIKNENISHIDIVDNFDNVDNIDNIDNVSTDTETTSVTSVTSVTSIASMTMEENEAENNTEILENLNPNIDNNEFYVLNRKLKNSNVKIFKREIIEYTSDKCFLHIYNKLYENIKHFYIDKYGFIFTVNDIFFYYHNDKSIEYSYDIENVIDIKLGKEIIYFLKNDGIYAMNLQLQDTKLKFSFSNEKPFSISFTSTIDQREYSLHETYSKYQQLLNLILLYQPNVYKYKLKLKSWSNENMDIAGISVGDGTTRHIFNNIIDEIHNLFFVTKKLYSEFNLNGLTNVIISSNNIMSNTSEIDIVRNNFDQYFWLGVILSQMILVQDIKLSFRLPVPLIIDLCKMLNKKKGKHYEPSIDELLYFLELQDPATYKIISKVNDDQFDTIDMNFKSKYDACMYILDINSNEDTCKHIYKNIVLGFEKNLKNCEYPFCDAIKLDLFISGSINLNRSKFFKEIQIYSAVSSTRNELFKTNIMNKLQNSTDEQLYTFITNVTGLKKYNEFYKIKIVEDNNYDDIDNDYKIHACNTKLEIYKKTDDDKINYIQYNNTLKFLMEVLEINIHG
jgi:hypothetical protein